MGACSAKDAKGQEIAKLGSSPEDAIPTEAVPRRELGAVEEASLSFFRCPCSEALVVREVRGETTRVYKWRGPGDDLGQGVDLRLQADGKDFNRLLLEQVQAGAYPACIPETHTGVLIHTDVHKAVRASLDALEQDVHNAFEKGVGLYNVDEYCVIFESWPEQYASQEELLTAFLRAPNDFVQDDTFSAENPLGVLKDFDTFNRFHPKKAGTRDDWQEPSGRLQVGDWYHIRIPGNNGDVMIVHQAFGEQRCSSTVQTMTDQEQWVNDDHPVSGRRQFGIEQLADGSHRFYTRGFDRQTSELMDLQVANMAQHASWSSCMRAIARRLGGRSQWPEEPDSWGWARQIPAEVLLANMLGVKG